METTVKLREGACDNSLKFPLSGYRERCFVKCLLTFSAVSHKDSILGREISCFLATRSTKHLVMSGSHGRPL